MRKCVGVFAILIYCFVFIYGLTCDFRNHWSISGDVDGIEGKGQQHFGTILTNLISSVIHCFMYGYWVSIAFTQMAVTIGYKISHFCHLRVIIHLQRKIRIENKNLC